MNQTIQQLGAGLWYLIHDRASKATDVKRRVALNQFILELADDFPCGACKTHFVEYVKKHPPSGASAEACLKWSWEFHDFVNVELCKPRMSWPVVREFYMHPKLCDGFCGGQTPEIPARKRGYTFI